MKALIIVDIQNDFLPGGALPVPNGDRVIPIIQHLVSLPFELIIASKDWHPLDHGSFADNHPPQKVGDHIQLGGVDQVLWPKHCVQNSWGADFAAGWNTNRIGHIIYKGTDSAIDSYSIFFDNHHLKSTGLENYLKEKNVTELYIAGLATDYCVFYSVKDALRLGFKVNVVLEGCKGIDLNPGDSQRAILEMTKLGAHIISVNDIR